MIGFQTGISAGRYLKQKLFDNEGMVIAHRIKGGRRYICKALKGNIDACTELEKILGRFPGIHYVRVSSIIGSVTVCYTQSERNINALFDALSHEIAGKHAVQEETLIPTSALTVGDNLNDSARRVVGRIKSFFNHTEPVFFTRVAAIALLVYGFNRIVINGDRPAGPQIMLWGLALLLRQSHPEPKNLRSEEQA